MTESSRFPYQEPKADPNGSLSSSLVGLGRMIPKLARSLELHPPWSLSSWESVLNNKLIPRLSPNLPLMAAICGGGSSGKSTLFNTLIGRAVSPTGGYAGLNRRVLVGLNPDDFASPGIESWLSTALDGPLGPLQDPDELTQPGAPLYTLQETVPPGLSLVDTPDFDTGAKGIYFNRARASKALELSDIIIYIFTNATYNNRENTDFIAKILSEIGQRKAFLIYRTYASFNDAEVRSHAETVARNLYGSSQSARHHILGIFRADEDNAVAAGARYMHLRELDSGQTSFTEALASIDPLATRAELLSSILEDVVQKAESIVASAEISSQSVAMYLDALRAAQSHAARQALAHFPMDRVMKRFAQIWKDTEPTHIQVMRRTGRVLETPWRLLKGSVRHLRSPFEAVRKPVSDESATRQTLENDLLQAVGRLQAQSLDSSIRVTLSARDPVAQKMLRYATAVQDVPPETRTSQPIWSRSAENDTYTFKVPIPPVLSDEQKKIRSQNWSSVYEAISSQASVLTGISEEIDAELKSLAKDFRSRMGLWDRLRQTFAAVLNVVPATVAVTYILSTGDPIGAAGIKVKLTGLFGLHDLYALVAVPATSGMQKTDHRLLENLLGPIAQTWLHHKLVSVQNIIEAQITAPLLARGQATLEETASLCLSADTLLRGLGSSRRKV